MLRRFTSYTDSIGGFWIVGEVVNGLPQAAEFVEITANLYSTDGTLLDTDFGYADLEVIAAGTDSPFSVLIFSPPSGVARFTIQVTDYRSPPYGGDEPVTGLNAVITNTFTDSIRFLHVVGAVTNSGSKTYKFVNPIIAFYNAAGDVVRVEDTYTNPDTLAPGQQGTFEAIANTNGVSVASRRIWVEASE